MLPADKYSSAVSFSSSVFDNRGNVLWYSGGANLLIRDSNFTNNVPVNISGWTTSVAGAAVELYPGSKVALIDVLLENNIAQPTFSGDNSFPSCGIAPSSCGGTIFIDCTHASMYTVVNLTHLHVKGNEYLGNIGGAIYIQTSSHGNLLLIDRCTFSHISSPGRGAALYIDDSTTIYSSDNYTNVTIINSI